MDSIVYNSIIKEYDDKKILYTLFTEKIHNLVSEVLKENSIPVHSITSRVKSRLSVEYKLNKHDASYSKLEDITDLAGVRIVTYFADDVDRISALIMQEFEIDTINSIDKRQILDPDRFGYLSMHHIASLLKQRSSLVEYRRFPTLKVEIQTRSILQHAWAEIEHDLGYKTNLGIPKNIRRKFSRLAGILELADEEFLSIRRQLEDYERDVAIKIKNIPSQVSLDKTSMLSFVTNSDFIKECDSYIASLTNGKLVDPNSEYIENLIPRLHFLGINTIADLQDILEKNTKYILPFARHWLKDSHTSLWNHGVTIFYLCYIILAEKHTDMIISKYLVDLNIGVDEKRKSLVDKIRQTFNSVEKELAP